MAREEFDVQFEETSACVDPIDVVVNDQHCICVFTSHNNSSRQDNHHEIDRITRWGISLVRHALREFSKVFALVAIAKNREFEMRALHRVREIVKKRPIHVIPVNAVEPRAYAQLLRDIIDHIHAKNI